jgi:hypothetical protein
MKEIMNQELLQHFQSKQPSVEMRISAGKKLRDKFPRNKQGVFKPAANRTDPVSHFRRTGKITAAGLWCPSGMPGC